MGPIAEITIFTIGLNERYIAAPSISSLFFLSVLKRKTAFIFGEIMSDLMLTVAAGIFLAFVLLGGFLLLDSKNNDIAPVFMSIGGFTTLLAFTLLSVMYDDTRSWSQDCRKDVGLALQNTRFSTSEIKTVIDVVCKED